MASLTFVFVSLLPKRVRFHVDVRLFSNRPQKTSKCGKNINHTLVCHFLVPTTFWRNGISLLQMVCCHIKTTSMVKSDLINTTRARNKEKSEYPTGIEHMIS